MGDCQKHKKGHCLGNWRTVTEASAPGQRTKGQGENRTQRDPSPVRVVGGWEDVLGQDW